MKDVVGPRNILHTFATDTDDPTVQPRWGKVGKQKIVDEGPLPPHPIPGIKYNMETVDEDILDHTLKFIDKSEKRKGQKLTGLDGVLAREGLGMALEMKAEADKDATARQKGLEEALAAFQAMQPDDKGAGRAYALYHQGRILMLLGKRDDAKAAFQKAKDIGKDKDADLAELVEERLAMLGA